MSAYRQAARRARILPPPSAAWAWFFDLDGTLIEIADVPSGVQVDEELRALLESLAQASSGALAVITGRPIADIDRLFPDLRLPVAGQHGVERRDRDGLVTHHTFPVAALDVARRRLSSLVARHPALLLEDKGLSLALHYRQAPSLAGYVKVREPGVLTSIRESKEMKGDVEKTLVSFMDGFAKSFA